MKNTCRSLLFLLPLAPAAALTLAGCGTKETATTQPTPSAVPRTGAQIVQGECAGCHSGKDPFMLIMGARSLDDSARMGEYGADYLKKIILGGGAAVGRNKAMPGFEGKLSEKEVDGVVAHLMGS